MKKVLAIDMGATSIRGIVGYIEDGQLKMEEVMRLSHEIQSEEGRLRWQWEKLLGTIAKTVKDCQEQITSVGVDTWGVDFGLVDQNGSLVTNPISYRDEAHKEGMEPVETSLGIENVFLRTGNQVMPINTLFQLLALQKRQEVDFEKVETILMIPDLVEYFLSGEKVGEETIWSTTQMMNLKTREIEVDWLQKLGVSPSIFPKIVPSGTVIGSTKHAKIESLRKKDTKVVAVCGHDTASAVLLTKTYEDDSCMFISCGTWSLIGGLVEEPIITKEVYQKELTNELGYGKKPLFFKNMTGLYLLEKYKKQLEDSIGRSISFEEITAHVEKRATPFDSIDMEEEIFGREDICAKKEIDKALKKRGASALQHPMDYFGVIYQSMVEAYQKTRKMIEETAGKKFTSVHMIGGGAKSSYLCQLIANQMQVPVTAGPFEASALGNIILQLKSCGEIGSVEEGINIALESQQAKHYNPKQ